MFSLIALYVIIRNTRINQLLLLLPAIILSGIVLAGYGCIELLTSKKALAGFSNPGPYAGYLAIIGCVALGMYVFKNQLQAVTIPLACYPKMLLFKTLPIIGIIFIAIVLPALRSRSAFLAIIAAAGYLLFCRYQLKIYGTKLMRIGLPLRLLLFSTITAVTLIALYTVYSSRIESSNGRMLIWKVTGNIIKDNLAFGVGTDGFKTYYMDAQAAYFNKHHHSPYVLLADNTYYAFNESLQFVAENGIVGVSLFALFIIALFRVKFNARFVFLIQLAVGALIAFLVFGMFAYPTQILPIKMVIVTLIALIANLDDRKVNFATSQIATGPGKQVPAIRYVAGLALFAGSVMIIYQGNILSSASFNWQNALNLYEHGNYKASLKSFDLARPYLQRDGDFMMNYGKALAFAGDNKKAMIVLIEARRYTNTEITETALGDVFKSLKRYQQAETAYIAATNMVPNRFYPLYLLAKLYNDTGNKDKAGETARLLLVKDVKIYSAAIAQMMDEMKKIAAEGKEPLNTAFN
ncbi:O-antigen ligase family protein [Mucilaginibacter limnophilus]|nr:O-antigen ligase family protein [Mucilaginibacter limnophilus]